MIDRPASTSDQAHDGAEADEASSPARPIGERLRGHLRANIVGYLALFVALGGTSAWAADKITSKDIAKNAVRSKQIKSNAVKTPEIAGGAVTADKLADNVEGSQGPQGPPGAPGAPGATNVRIRQVAMPIGATMGMVKQANAPCMPGEVATGGGVSAANIGFNQYVIGRSTAGGGDGMVPTEWSVAVVPTVNDVDAAFFVKAVCASP